MLGGLDHPSKGEVFFASSRSGRLPNGRWRASALSGADLFGFNLIPTMTARENVALALAFGGLRGQQRRTRSVSCWRALDLAIVSNISLPSCPAVNSNESQ